MTTVTSKDAQNRFGQLIDTAQREPVSITRHDRPVAVIMSVQRYEELEAIEDAIWLARAKEAEKSGFLSVEATEEFIRKTLNAETETE